MSILLSSFEDINELEADPDEKLTRDVLHIDNIPLAFKKYVMIDKEDEDEKEQVLRKKAINFTFR